MSINQLIQFDIFKFWNEFANIISVLDIFDRSITFRIYGCRNDDEELENLMENLFIFFLKFLLKMLKIILYIT